MKRTLIPFLCFLLLSSITLSISAAKSDKKIRVKKLPVSISGLGADIRLSKIGEEAYEVFVEGQGTRFTEGSTQETYILLGHSDLYLAERVQFSSPQAGSPTLISINPANGFAGQNVTAQVIGFDTHFTEGSHSIRRPHSNQIRSNIYENIGKVASAVTRSSQFNIPAGAPSGWYHTRHFSNTDGYLGLNQSFYIASPTCHISSVSPNYAYTGQNGVNLTINGFFTNFNAASSTMNQLRQGSFIIPEVSKTVHSHISRTGVYNIPSNAPTGWYHWEHMNSVNGYIAYANALYVDFSVQGEELRTQVIENFNLLPNPVKDLVYIQLAEGLQEKEREFILRDVTGKELQTFKIISGGGNHAISVGHLTPGIYWVEMRNKHHRVVQKLLKE